MLLGRDREQGELLAALGSGPCSVVILGEAGVGKTALLREVTAATGQPVFEGGALATLSWSAYLPLRRALGETAREWDGDPEFVAARVEDALGDGILLLDDLQWADAATLSVVELLAGRLPLLAAVRRGDEATDAVLSALTSAGFAVVELDPLEDATALELARSLQPGLSDGAAATIVRRSGGNPLLIEELAAAGGDASSLGLAVRERTRSLSLEARGGLALLALAGRALAAAAVPGAAELREAGLVREAGGELDIRHALVAEAVLAGLDDARRRALHRELAELLEHPGDRARHLLAAGEFSAGYEAALEAVKTAATPGERSAQLVTAALCAPKDAEPELRLSAAQAALEAGDYAQLGSILAGLPEDDVLQARAGLLRARALSEAGDQEKWDEVLSEALRRVRGGDSDIEVALLVEQARSVLFRTQDLTAAATLAEQALESARRRGVHLGRAHYVVGTIQYYAGDPRWQESLSEALELARSEGDLNTELIVANNFIVGHEGGGDPALAVAFAERMMARADELKLLRWRRHFWAARLNLATHAGEYELVVRSAPELLGAPLMRRTREEMSSSWALSLVELGRIDEGLAVGEEALADSTLHRSNLHQLRIVAHELSGRPEAALAECDAFLASAEDAHRIAFAAPVLQWAAYQLGRPPVELPELSQAVEVPLLRGVPVEIAGIEELRVGRYTDAAERFASAAELWAPYNRQGEVRSRWAQGHALAEAGESEAAIEVLVAAEELAARHGMEPMLARIRRSLRALGVMRSAPRKRSTGTALTERERQVLALVARDLSDATIAARLGVSARTVESQIASARRKLGATNRRHAAALASEVA